MFATRSTLDASSVRILSLQATQERFQQSRDYIIAATERLGELYANCDEDDPDDVARITDLEIEVAIAQARYEEALTRCAWEINEARRAQTPQLPPAPVQPLMLEDRKQPNS